MGTKCVLVLASQLRGLQMRWGLACIHPSALVRDGLSVAQLHFLSDARLDLLVELFLGGGPMGVVAGLCGGGLHGRDPLG